MYQGQKYKVFIKNILKRELRLRRFSKKKRKVWGIESNIMCTFYSTLNFFSPLICHKKMKVSIRNIDKNTISYRRQTHDEIVNIGVFGALFYQTLWDRFPIFRNNSVGYVIPDTLGKEYRFLRYDTDLRAEPLQIVIRNIDTVNSL